MTGERISLKVEEIEKDDLWNAEVGGMEGKDQGNSQVPGVKIYKNVQLPV